MEDFGNRHKDSSAKYVQGELPPLPPEYNEIVKSLDKEMLAAAKKTKGLFKKAFFIIWPSVIAITAILVFIFSGDTSIIFGVGGFLGAFISAIAAFIYKLLTKAKSAEVFMAKLKKELVGKILKFVNSNLSFSNEGISKEVYDKADLIGGRRFESEDSIDGKVNGLNVKVSECKLTLTETVSFNGIFIQLELSSVNLSTPLKIIPHFASESNFDKRPNLNPLAQTRYVYKRINIEKEDQIALDPTMQKSDYEFFCKDKQVANSFINQGRLKVLDYIFTKYKDERASVLSTLPFLKDHDANSGIYMSIIGNMLYIALDWNEDLFAADVLLEEGIEETGLAQKIHRDLHFINQIINEVSLLDKVNG
ncbi:MAG: DUF3137 domain-containing protein [Cyclobacteriaceae bacterium]|nr:DUF3137 domain-containing protein [Cyclobacteriaceae bacterium]